MALKYNFPTSSEPADFERMAAIYKGAEGVLDRNYAKDWPPVVAVLSGLLLVCSLVGAVASFVIIPSAIGFVVGAIAWWQRKKERDAEHLLQIYVQRWFEERGYWIRWGGHYEKKRPSD